MIYYYKNHKNSISEKSLKDLLRGNLKDLFWISMLENQSEFAEKIFEALCEEKTYSDQSTDVNSPFRIDEYFSREVIPTRFYDFEMLFEVWILILKKSNHLHDSNLQVINNNYIKIICFFNQNFLFSKSIMR